MFVFQRRFVGLFIVTVGPSVISLAAQKPKAVQLFVQSGLEAPSQFGFNELERALKERQYQTRRVSSVPSTASTVVIACGLCTAPPIQALLSKADVEVPVAPESVVIQWAPQSQRARLVVCGTDHRGLMYAALEVADKLRFRTWLEDPLSSINNTVESPFVQERSVTRMLMNKAVVEQYLFDESYWREYFKMLARYRFNTFTLMFGYGSAGYFEPVYPYLFDVEGFPEVRFPGVTAKDQQRYLETFRRIIQLAHDHGLNVTVALWTHIFEPGYNNYLEEASGPWFVRGLTRENLVPYTKAALKKFLQQVPGIDRIQFRVHTESSVTLPQQKQFSTEIVRAIQDSGVPVPIDMRAKGFTDDLIEAITATGVPFRVTTKYWGEELGMPFHPTQDTLGNKYKRRHSYADLLRYPKKYDLLWRLWAHGSIKVLLWGNPEWARRFAETTHLYDGVGFDTHEPLAMKMGYKMGLHDATPFELLAEPYHHYKWEFQRYWHFYQSLGRLTYNPNASPDAYLDEFRYRFGVDAGPLVQKLYERASSVIPRIVAYVTRDLSAANQWPGKQRQDDLPDYIYIRPSDTAQFLGIEEAARFYLKGKRSPKIWPERNSRWFEETSESILRLADQVERAAGHSTSKELKATLIDMRVLGYLAQYHSRRIYSGFHYALYRYSGDVNALDSAIEWEKHAIQSWENIVRLTDGVYPDNIILGRAPLLSGSWKTELETLKKGLAKLQQERDQFQPKLTKVVARFDFGNGPVEQGYTGVSTSDRYLLHKGGYGWYHLYEKHEDATIAPSAPAERLRDFIAGPNPREYTYSAFGVDLPDGNYEVLIEMGDFRPNAVDHGPMWIAVQGRNSTERFVVPAGQLVQKRLPATVVDGRLSVVLNAATDGSWIINSLTVERVGPQISHVPARRTDVSSDLEIRATVASEDPIETVELLYGNTIEGFRTLPMKPIGKFRYAATIPRADLTDNLEYFIRAVDARGRTVTFPQDGDLNPVVVNVTADQDPPLVEHTPVTRWSPGKPLEIRARVVDPSGVGDVYVRFRGVNQHQDFQSLRLLPTGEPHEYAVTIPGEALDPRWDFMYYLVAFDQEGNGTIHPNLDVATPYFVVRLHSPATVSLTSP